MWSSSGLAQGWQVVAAATQTKYGTRLPTLSREVCGAYKKSKGSEEGLQQLIKTPTPRQTTPPTAPPGGRQEQQITPQEPKSGSNQASITDGAPGRAPSGAPDPIFQYVTALDKNDSLSVSMLIVQFHNLYAYRSAAGTIFHEKAPGCITKLQVSFNPRQHYRLPLAIRSYSLIYTRF